MYKHWHTCTDNKFRCFTILCSFLSLSIDPSGTTGSQKKRPAGAVPMFGGSDSKGLFGDDDDEASAEPAQAKSEPQRVRLCIACSVKRMYIV